MADTSRFAILAPLSMVVVMLLWGCTSSPKPAAPTPQQADGIHYLDTGGPDEAIIFVHGWASSNVVWAHQLDGFGDPPRWRLIAIDLPGHGESDMPVQKLTMDLFADAIAEVMDDAGVEEAVLIGHSNGTPVIRQFERRYPDRTRALVTVDGALREVFPPQALTQFIEMLNQPNYQDIAVSFLDQARPNRWSEKDQERIEQMMRSTPQRTMVEGLQAAADPAIWGDDPIQAPVLMINAESPFWTDRYYAQVREIAPDIEIHTLPGVTHFLIIDDPQRFNELVTDFIERRGLLSGNE